MLAIMSFIQFIGFISVARGITILNNVSKNRPDASLGKGLTHIVGGIMACNILLTSQMLANTFFPNGTL
jgi:intracellular multiplication protein IcmC